MPTKTVWSDMDGWTEGINIETRTWSREKIIYPSLSFTVTVRSFEERQRVGAKILVLYINFSR